MVTLLEQWSNGQKQYAGLSTDERPIGANNGDALIEMDTAKIYLYSESDDTWYEQPVGSGGGGDSDFSLANVTFANTTQGVPYRFWAAFTYDSDTAEYPSSLSVYKDSVSGDSTFTIPLYKGVYYLYDECFENIASLEDAVLDGSAVWDDDEGAVKITGDCTITLAAQDDTEG